MRALALVLCIGCGAAAPRASAANQQAGAVARPAPQAEWRQCRIADGALVLWLAVPIGAAVDVDDDICFVVPHEGDTPETAEWVLAIGAIGSPESHAELLAIEPDGARQFLLAVADVRGVRLLEEGALPLLGTTTRAYSMQGFTDELGGLREFTVARVRESARVWVMALVVVRPGAADRRQSLLELAALARH